MAGTIKGITIEFDGNVTKLDKALSKVRNSTKDLDRELRDIDKALKFNPSSVTLWGQKQDALKEKIKTTEKNLEELRREKERLDDDPAVDKTSAEYRALERAIVENESKLKHFRSELKKIGNVKLKALGEQFKQVGKKMTEAGKNLTTKVTAPIVAVGAVAANKFAEVDKIMQLTNSTMGNTEEQADLLNQAMKEAAASSTYGMQDAATATLNFARAGLTAEQAANALAPSMALAAGEGGELDTVSAGLVATINGFHGSFEDAGTYADIFANACNNSALDVNSLSSAMSVAAPIFSAAGYAVNDAALFMGVMANNGIEADKAANSLKTGLARLVSPAKDGAEMMDELDFSITNADGTMKNSVQVQKELHDKFAELSEAEQIAAASAIFGKNQMAPWLALINTAPGDVTALNEALSQNGTAMDMQSSMMSGFGGSIEQLKSGVDVLATSFGEALAPILQVVINALQGLIDWFNSLSPEMQSVIAVIAVVVAAIGPLLLILGVLASSIGSIISLVGVVGPVIGGLMTGSLLPIIGVIAAVIAVGVLLYKNWDKIKAMAQALWNKLKTTFNGIKTTIITTWNNIKTAIHTAISTIYTQAVNKFLQLKNRVTTIFNSVKEAITKPIQKAKEIVQSAIDKIKSIINGAHLKLPHFKLPHFKITKGVLPWGIGGKGTPPSISVDWYAKGGIFNSPSVIGVGEAGSEAVVPLDKFWDKLDHLHGETNVVININGANKDPREIAEEVKRALIRETNQRRLAWQ